MNGLSFPILAFCSLLILPIFGQVGILDKEVPAAPESHILDVDRVFLGKDDLLGELSENLLELKRKHNIDLYVVVYKGLIGTNATDQAAIFHKYWLGSKNEGLVAVFDMQNSHWLAWGMSQALYTGAYDDLGYRPRLAYFKVSEMLSELDREARQKVEQNKNGTLKFADLSAELVNEVMLNMSGKIDEALDSQIAASQSSRKNIRFMAWLATALSMLGLLMLLLIKFFAKVEIRAKKTYEFPDVLVGERLGAVYGGGKSSSVNFDPSSVESSSGRR